MRSKGDFPSACYTCHFIACQLGGEYVRLEDCWPPLDEPWITPGKKMVQWRSNWFLQSPRDASFHGVLGHPGKWLLKTICSLISWQLSNPSSSGDCVLTWERTLEIRDRQLLREGRCLVLSSAGLFSYRAVSFLHLSVSPFLFLGTCNDMKFCFLVALLRVK